MAERKVSKSRKSFQPMVNRLVKWFLEATKEYISDGMIFVSLGQ